MSQWRISFDDGALAFPLNAIGTRLLIGTATNAIVRSAAWPCAYAHAYSSQQAQRSGEPERNAWKGGRPEWLRQKSYRSLKGRQGQAGSSQTEVSRPGTADCQERANLRGIAAAWSCAMIDALSACYEALDPARVTLAYHPIARRKVIQIPHSLRITW